VLTNNETPLPVAKSDVVYRALPDGAVLFSILEEFGLVLVVGQMLRWHGGVGVEARLERIRRGTMRPSIPAGQLPS
jgi:hypothetical protein